MHERSSHRWALRSFLLHPRIFPATAPPSPPLRRSRIKSLFVSFPLLPALCDLSCPSCSRLSLLQTSTSRTFGQEGTRLDERELQNYFDSRISANICFITRGENPDARRRWRARWL